MTFARNDVSNFLSGRFLPQTDFLPTCLSAISFRLFSSEHLITNFLVKSSYILQNSLNERRQQYPGRQFTSSSKYGDDVS